MNKKLVLAVVVIAIAAAGIIGWSLGSGGGGGKSADEKVNEAISSNAPTWGNSTQPARVEVEPGEGDDGGNVAEQLPELSLPKGLPDATYIEGICDKAQLSLNLKQKKNIDQMHAWFRQAPGIVGPTAKDPKLIAILNAAKASNGEFQPIVTACNK